MSAAVQVKGKGFCDALNRLGEQLDKVTLHMVEDTARYAQKHATETRLFERRTGRLHMGTEAVFVPSEYRSYIINSVFYAKWIEEGTDPHWIYPKNGGKLRFYWEKIGQTVEVDKVNHPGTKAYPFFKSSGYLAEGFLENRLNRFVRANVLRFNAGK